MARFVPSPGFEERAANALEMRALLRALAAKVGGEAERIGRQVSKSYTTDIEDSDDGVRVVASTGQINAASWIEFGNQNLPAYAPLRKGAESAGLKTRAGR